MTFSKKGDKIYTHAVHSCSVELLSWKVYQNLQESTCNGVFFSVEFRAKTKRGLHCKLFYCQFCKIFPWLFYRTHVDSCFYNCQIFMENTWAIFLLIFLGAILKGKDPIVTGISWGNFKSYSLTSALILRILCLWQYFNSLMTVAVMI